MSCEYAIYGYPNHIPLDEATVAGIARRAGRFSFDRIYGGWWGRVVMGDGAAAVRRSAERYVARLHGERPARLSAQRPVTEGIQAR